MKKILLFIPVLFLSACGIFFSPPEVVVRDIKLITADTSGANFDIYFELTNTNSYDITLKGYSYEVKVLDLPFAQGGGRETKVFKGNSTTDIRMPVRVAYLDLIDIIKHRPELDRIPYKVSAGFEVDTPIGGRCFPVEKAGTFAVPEEYRPSFYLKKLLDIFRKDEK